MTSKKSLRVPAPPVAGAPSVDSGAPCSEALKHFLCGSPAVIVTDKGSPCCVLRPADMLAAVADRAGLHTLPAGSFCGEAGQPELPAQHDSVSGRAAAGTPAGCPGEHAGLTDGTAGLLLADVVPVLNMAYEPLHPDEPLLNAMEALAECENSVVLVLDGKGTPALLERGDVAALMDCSDDPWSTPLGSCARGNVLSLPSATGVQAALNRLENSPYSHVLVTDDRQEPAGLMSVRELRHAAAIRDAQAVHNLLDWQRIQLNQELREHSQRLAQLENYLSAHLRTGIIGISPQGRILFCSGPALDILHAITPVNPTGKELHVLALSIDFFRKVQQALAGCDASSLCTFSYTLPHPEQNIIHCTLSHLAENGQPLGQALTMREAPDSSDHLSLEQQAFYDALTGLPNRHLFAERVSQEMRRSRRDGLRFALAFLDLDNFKEINDTYGHLLGDSLLQEVARRLQRGIRASDTVARFGGDEFLALLPETAPGTPTLNVLEKLRNSLDRPFVLDGHELTLCCSIGVAHYPDDASSVSGLMNTADKNMYKDKAARRLTGCRLTSDGQ
ncbi:diguanylate cyclase domain-containing protein [Oleidesulfovibrio alaskensis]